MVAFAKAGIAGPGAERRIKGLVPEPHLVVHWHKPRDESPTGLRTFLLVVHVVLLEWAEAAIASLITKPILELCSIRETKAECLTAVARTFAHQ